ncbi:MAG: eukaryotic-like serine/threonine-protein kinase, partial [Kribbellaceae bacterium]|nr:eukaryotic-like serine/threonine-protein kinase [Kribbellaceae bacterium]
MLVAERYRLGEPLGRGGMGEVYRATDEVLDRQVAIKLLLPVRESVAAEERFLREARAAAMISDPHVVAALDFGKHGDGHFLAMELVEGRTVSEELRTHGPLPPDRAV